MFKNKAKLDAAVSCMILSLKCASPDTLAKKLAFAKEVIALCRKDHPSAKRLHELKIAVLAIEEKAV
jgi:hypothetical protein